MDVDPESARQALTLFCKNLEGFEEIVRENLQHIENFNRDAPLIPGLTLRVNGERRTWPASVEREDALLWMIAEIRRLLSEDPLDETAAVSLIYRLQEEMKRVDPLIVTTDLHGDGCHDN